jgi:diguanylate cyclase (GGDEF)-like protein
VSRVRRQYSTVMFAARRNAPSTAPPSLKRGDFVYSLLLFLVAVALLAYLMSGEAALPIDHGWRSVLFFLSFGLFTIAMGYSRPGYAYISFDRVAQISSILVLGPLAAAWINGIASLIYPWHRLRNGTALRTIITASLHNSGMVVLSILLCGSLYVYLGGQVPLQSLDLTTCGLLLLLMLSMQLLMDMSMMFVLYLRRADPSKLHTVFSTGVEFASVLIAIVFAIVFVRMETAVTVLLLVVLGLGMLGLKQFAKMRYELESLVDDRTEALRLKTLELERQATHDKLTGLFNRRYADDFLQREIEISKRHGRPLSIALADVDHFKEVNDRHSHAVGDKVLRSVAKILTERCRNTDIVARYGGEEFLLCFPDTQSGFAEQICNQIGKSIEELDWSSYAARTGRKIGVTMSFGVAQLGDDPRRARLLADADTRLYQAKRKGRNRVVA